MSRVAWAPLFIACVCCSSLAFAANKIEFDISSQRADRALTLFAQKAKLLILFPNRDIRHVRTNTLNGYYTVDEGLKVLLLDTGLEVEQSASNQLVVKLRPLKKEGPAMASTLQPKKKSIFGRAIAILASVLAVSSGHAQQQEAGNSVIEEIIVTAERRAQSVQDVSISITAFDADTIRELRISNPADLGQLTPGLEMNPTGNAQDPIFTLRSIGMNSLEANADPAVGIYFDEVVMPYFPMLGIQLFDLERIEVVKGPQGTLYGRNTTGGAINFITRKPTQQFEANVRMDYGRYDLMEFEGSVGGGIGDTLAVRFAATSTIQDGWQTLRLGPDAADSVDTRNGDIDRQAVRGELLWTPSSNFDALITVDSGWDHSEAMAFAHAGNVSRSDPGANHFCIFATDGIRSEGADGECASLAIRRDPVTGVPLTGDLELVYDTTPDNLREVDASFSYGNKVDTDSKGVNGTLNWTLDRLTVTSITGYRNFERLNGLDNGSPYVVSDGTKFNEFDIFTQELRFASNDTWDKLDWIFGLYYSNDDVKVKQTYDYQDHFQFFGLFHWDYDQNTKTYAAFSNIGWHFNDKWMMRGGLRFTKDDRSIEFIGSETRSGPKPLSALGEKSSTKDLSGTIGIDYAATDDLLMYIKFSKGFKAAGFPSAISFSTPQLAPFDKETILAYEGGLKSTLNNGRLQFNASVYYYDWQNFQAQAAVEREGLRLIVLTNAGDARVRGLEVESVWSPIRELRFQLGFNWMDSKIQSGQYDGDRTAHAPKLTLNGMAQWQGSNEVRGVVPFAHVDFSFQDHVEYILPNTPGAEQNSYWLFNARAGIKDPSGKWELAGWIRNIGDRTYSTDVYGPGSTFLPGRILLGAPRMYGVSFSYHF